MKNLKAKIRHRTVAVPSHSKSNRFDSVFRNAMCTHARSSTIPLSSLSLLPVRCVCVRIRLTQSAVASGSVLRRHSKIVQVHLHFMIFKSRKQKANGGARERVEHFYSCRLSFVCDFVWQANGSMQKCTEIKRAMGE